jgi:hypothetical protein
MFLRNSYIQTEQDKLDKNIRNNAMWTTGLKPYFITDHHCITLLHFFQHFSEVLRSTNIYKT